MLQAAELSADKPLGAAEANEVANKVNLADFGGKKDVNGGYQKLPNGLMIQWGTCSIGTGLGDVIKFPSAFTNACLQIIACDCGGGAHQVGICVNSLSSFKVWGKDNGSYCTTAISWLAIGY